jgi:hypothetical protein
MPEQKVLDEELIKAAKMGTVKEVKLARTRTAGIRVGTHLSSRRPQVGI